MAENPGGEKSSRGSIMSLSMDDMKVYVIRCLRLLKPEANVKYKRMAGAVCSYASCRNSALPEA